MALRIPRVLEHPVCREEVGMATYFLFGTYSPESIQEISAERTDQALALIQEHGGAYKAGYALLGEYDLVVIVDLPGTEQAIQVSVGLAKLLGISFTTAPAVSMEAFDELVG
jgi:uncharacterized protein with GYD domain